MWMEGFMCVCDQSFGIAHLGVKSSYFSKDSAESEGEQLSLWLTRFQLHKHWEFASVAAGL